jgi:hypothetical protein
MRILIGYMYFVSYQKHLVVVVFFSLKGSAIVIKFKKSTSYKYSTENTTQNKVLRKFDLIFFLQYLLKKKERKKQGLCGRVVTALV